jgi:hypothetical protein
MPASARYSVERPTFRRSATYCRASPLSISFRAWSICSAMVEQTITSTRIPRAMDLYRFVLGIVLGLYIGFPISEIRTILTQFRGTALANLSGAPPKVP